MWDGHAVNWDRVNGYKKRGDVRRRRPLLVVHTGFEPVFQA